MATSRFLLAVFSVCLLLQNTVAINNIRILKQLVEFKAEMRRELEYIHVDILELFESNKNRSKLETRENPDAPKDEGVIVNAEELPNAAGKGNQEMVIKEMLVKYEHLLRAFQSEKRTNRHLQQRLVSFEKRVTYQLSSAVEMSSVKEYVDQSIDKKVLEGVQIVNESNAKTAEDVRNIAGDFLIISEDMDSIKMEVKNVSNIVNDLGDTVDKVKEYVDKSIDKKVLKGVQIVNESNAKTAEDVRNIAGDFLIIRENMDTIKMEVKNVSNIVNDLGETVDEVKEYVDQSIDKKVLEGVQIVNESNAKIAKDVRNISDDFLVINENMDTINTEVKNVSNIVKDLGETVNEVNKRVNSVEQSFKNVHPKICNDVTKSGVYNLNFGFMQTTVPVYCDQDIDGGGWVVILRRQDGSGDFNRSWAEYREGFGDREGEFWAGNELIHQLTISKPTQLRIDMETFDGESKFAQYGDFQIGPEEDKYRLNISDYAGTAGDSMIDSIYGTNNGQAFSTLDRDNDNWWGNNCAESEEGGWWYNDCGPSYLTSRYSYTGDISDDYIGIIWRTLTGWDRSLKFVEMKIRPVQ